MVIDLGLITLSLRFLMKVWEYNSKEEDYVLEVAEELEKLYSSQSYKYFLHNNEIKETIERFKYPKSSIN